MLQMVSSFGSLAISSKARPSQLIILSLLLVSCSGKVGHISRTCPELSGAANGNGGNYQSGRGGGFGNYGGGGGYGAANKSCYVSLP